MAACPITRATANAWRWKSQCLGTGTPNGKMCNNFHSYFSLIAVVGGWLACVPLRPNISACTSPYIFGSQDLCSAYIDCSQEKLPLSHYKVKYNHISISGTHLDIIQFAFAHCQARLDVLLSLSLLSFPLHPRLIGIESLALRLRPLVNSFVCERTWIRYERLYPCTLYILYFKYFFVCCCSLRSTRIFIPFFGPAFILFNFVVMFAALVYGNRLRCTRCRLSVRYQCGDSE